MAKGRKIKRVKSLYKPRKSRSRKAIEVAVMLAVICTLGFVGWSIGSAIFNYSPPNEQPVGRDALGAPEIEPEMHEDGTPGTSYPTPDEPDPPVALPTHFNAITAPSSVLDNVSSLAAYIRQAELSGFNAVVLEIKDSTGHLFYESGFEPIQGSDIIRGTLTAEQIFAAFEETGVKPILRLNTLLDRLAPSVLADVSYVFETGGRWADDRLENGGKLWANPFLQGTRDYHLFIVDELVNAGFTDIILANMTFPHFRNYDRSVIAAEFTAPATRYNGLTGFVNALEVSSATFYLEMTVRDVVESYAGFGGTAEILRGRRYLDGFELLLVYNKEDFGTEYRTGEHSTVALPADTGALVSLVFKQAENQTSGFEITPFLNRDNLTDREITDILGVFTELGYENFVIR
ncbi:MAG: putative glycoside hydrolase [Oscillospiraceae bacterium]|nr:putative glycoside hydrolase [Oscillospiraceae bacterium]